MKKLLTSLVIFSCCAFQAAFAQVDVGIVSVVSPVSGCALTANTPVTVLLNNFGNMDAEGGMNVEYNYTINNNLVTGPSFLDSNLEVFVNTPVSYTFTDLMDVSTPGTYVLTITIGPFPGEVNTANNTIVHTFYNYGPAIVVTPATPYFQDFETPGHLWATTSGTANPSSWELGTPVNSFINSSYGGGVNSWITNRTGQYANNESSFLNTPCFDLTPMAAPEVEFAIWWNAQIGDGAVLQYSENGGATWARVGNVGDTVNWYNYTTVGGLVAATNQQHGWSGTGTNSSGGWVIARHDLIRANGTYLTVNGLRFRFVFGSNTTGVADGVAIDNFIIREKLAHDIVLLNYEPFSQGCGLGTAEHITLNFFNNGSQPLNSGDFQLRYVIDGITVTETYNGPTIPPYTFASYTFTATQNFTTATSYSIFMEILFPPDLNQANNSKTNIIYNSVVPENHQVDFETGTPALSQFAIDTRQHSRVLVENAAAFQGNFGMVMDGSTTPMPWSDFDALVDPWAPTSNPDRFSQAVICVKVPSNLDSMKLTFRLKQLFNQNFLYTNFRLTANGQPIPFTHNNVLFQPSQNNNALRPPVVADTTTNTWRHVIADLTPYIDSGDVSIQIAFESSVRHTYNQTTLAGNANLIDNINIESTYFDCAVTPYHPKCPCGPVYIDPDLCCPDPDNINCPQVNCNLTPYDPACPCGPVQFTIAACCPDPNNPLCPPDTMSSPEMVHRGAIKVYPNPSKGEIAVDLSSLTPDMYAVEILDVTGRIVRREMVMMTNQPSYVMDLSAEPKGMYMVKISSETKIHTGIVVIQ